MPPALGPLHDRAHSLTSTDDHTLSGATAGHLFAATSATAFAFQAPGTQVIRSGTMAQMLAAAGAPDGALWYATDHDGGTLFRSNGTKWIHQAASLAAGLRHKLMLYLPLTEASGARADSHSSKSFTDNNTVTASTGLDGSENAAQFTAANNEYLSLADEDDINAGGISHSGCCWVYFDSLSTGSANRVIASKAHTSTNTLREWQVRLQGATPAIQFQEWNGTSAVALASSAITYATATWYFVGWVCDLDAQKMRLYVDATQFEGNFTGTTSNTAQPLEIGREGNSASVNQSMDGRIARFAWWRRALSAEEMAYLRGGGVSGATRYRDIK